MGSIDSDRGAVGDLHQPGLNFTDAVTTYAGLLFQLDLADVAANTLLEIDSWPLDGSRGTRLLAHAAMITLLHTPDTF